MTAAIRRAAALLAACAAMASSVAIAPLGAQDAPPATLLPGKGAELTMSKCSICHEIGHVTRSRLTRAEWDDNIKVMIARGMPIEPREIPIVLDYLSTYYNRDTPPPVAAAGDAAPAASGPDVLVATHGCTACHAADKKIVGPSFREIASRYKGDASVAAKLGAKIKEGGAGAWGAIPMPPHPQIDERDLTAMVGWVLRQ